MVWVAAEQTVRAKSKAFAVRIIHLYELLTREQKEYVLAKQVLRSGTSIGANVVEAGCAISRKEFLAKNYIAFKECAETLYWLELLYETGYLSQAEYSSIEKDCQELKRMLSSITKTTQLTL